MSTRDPHRSTDAPTAPSPGRRWLWASAAFVTLLFGAAVALAGLPGDRPHRGFGHGAHDYMQWRLEKMLDRVDVTDEQKAEIVALVEARIEGFREMHDGRRAHHEEIVSLLTAETIDRAAVEQMRAEHLAKFDEITRDLGETLVEVAEVLTPEQRLELAELARKHRGRRWHR